MKNENPKNPEWQDMLKLLNDTCNLLARQVRQQELEILRLREEVSPARETRPKMKKFRVN